MAFCSKCGVQVNDGAGFCQACGVAVAGAGAASAIPMAPPPPAGASAGMTNNVAGLLCYAFGIISAVIFLVIDPYKNIRFVRFHAFQSLFYSAVCIVFLIVWSWLIVGIFLSGGGIGGLGLFGLIGLVRLAMFGGWIFLMIKAYNNEEFRLPIIGDLAAKQAGI